MKLVIQNMSRVWGGNEKWLSILSRGLLDRGHEVVVSCPPGPVRETLHERGIPVSAHRPRGAVDVPSALDFAIWLRTEKPDALLLTSWRSTTWSTIAAHLSGVRRVVMRLGIVRTFPPRGPRALALARGVDALIVNSSEIRTEWLRSRPRAMSDNVHVVMNAIRDLRVERNSRRDALRRELAVPPETLLIGGAGHLSARKGFDILLRAFAAADVHDSNLVIIGDGEDRIHLASLADAMGIGHHVHWLGHRIDGPELIAGLDLFALSSHNEGMANVMLEAMAGGVPVIAGDISGVRTALDRHNQSREAGWIFPAGDLDGLAVRLQEVSEQIRAGSKEVEARIDEATRRIRTWFGPSRMVDECEAILFEN